MVRFWMVAVLISLAGCEFLPDESTSKDTDLKQVAAVAIPDKLPFPNYLLDIDIPKHSYQTAQFSRGDILLTVYENRFLESFTKDPKPGIAGEWVYVDCATGWVYHDELAHNGGERQMEQHPKDNSVLSIYGSWCKDAGLNPGF